MPPLHLSPNTLVILSRFSRRHPPCPPEIRTLRDSGTYLLPACAADLLGGECRYDANAPCMNPSRTCLHSGTTGLYRRNSGMGPLPLDGRGLKGVSAKRPKPAQPLMLTLETRISTEFDYVKRIQARQRNSRTHRRILSRTTPAICPRGD
jgi:hypothetical protein